LLLGPDGLIYIAMAGSHQIWTLDVKEDRLDLYAGDGRENIRDGSLASALFAQPSGLTTDGKELFIADSEVSAIRAVSLGGRGGAAAAPSSARASSSSATRTARATTSCSSMHLACSMSTASSTWRTRTTARSRCSTRRRPSAAPSSAVTAAAGSPARPSTSPAA